MSLERFIKIIGINYFNPTEDELIKMLPKALQHFNPNRSQWTPVVVEKMLIMRYGLCENNEHSFRQLSDIYGKTGSRVMQVESKAFRCIRRYILSNVPNAESYPGAKQ